MTTTKIKLPKIPKGERPLVTYFGKRKNPTFILSKKAGEDGHVEYYALYKIIDAKTVERVYKTKRALGSFYQELETKYSLYD